MKYFFLSAVLAILLIGNVQAADEAASDVLAQVGNQQITRDMLDNIINTIPEENRVRFLTPDGRKKILDEVVFTLLLSEAAKSEGIDKEAPVKTRLDYARDEYLGQEYMRRFIAKSPQISEAEMESYYKEHQAEFKPPEEIQARHILVKTEAEANKIMDQLKGGKDFAELAQKHSIDPAGQRGGKLELPDGRDWLPKGTFEKSFETALFKIQKGQMDGPMKTQFGWHILKVDDRRQLETPAFVQVRAFIKNRLQEQKNMEAQKQLTEDLKKKIPVSIK